MSFKVMFYLSLCECNQQNQVHYEENWKPNPKPKITQTGIEPNYKIDRTEPNPTCIYKFDSHL